MTARTDLRQREKAPFTRINLPHDPANEPQSWHDTAPFLWSLFVVYVIAIGVCIYLRATGRL